MICVSCKSLNERLEITIKIVETIASYIGITLIHDMFNQIQLMARRAEENMWGSKPAGPNPFLNVSIMQFQERRGNEGINDGLIGGP